MNDFNQVIEYLEAHLTDEEALKDVAKVVGVNEYHLKRTFSFFFGITISEYIRLRRLTLANQDLLDGNAVTETAFKYGYQSVEGFSRAFKEFATVSPSDIYATRIQKVFVPFKTEIIIQGGLMMDFRIVDKPAFNLVGVSKRVPIQFEGENEAIKELALSITPQQKEQMDQLEDLEPNQVVNASYQFDETRMEEAGSLTHFIGVITTKSNDGTDLRQLTVPAYTWAIFPSKGEFPQKMQETWGNIYAEWLPQSEYQLEEAPEISFVDYSTPERDRYTEIWLAVSKR